MFKEDEGLFMERKRSVWKKETRVVLQDNPDGGNLAKMLGKTQCSLPFEIADVMLLSR